MLTIYATALAVGGALLLASVLFGHHGVEHSGDFHFGHHGGETGGHGGGGGVSGFVGLTFLSLRFWTFAAAFFGLTGVLFEKLRLVHDEREVLLAALILGLGSGLAAVTIVNRLRREVVSSLSAESSYAGLTGEVILAIGPDQPGKVRVSSKGSLIDLSARAREGESLATGTRALVLDVNLGIALVTPAPASATNSLAAPSGSAVTNGGKP